MTRIAADTKVLAVVVVAAAAAAVAACDGDDDNFVACFAVNLTLNVFCQLPEEMQTRLLYLSRIPFRAIM